MSTRGGRRPDAVPPYLVWVTRHESGLIVMAGSRSTRSTPGPVELLGPKLGRLNPEALARVDASLRFVLGLA